NDQMTDPAVYQRNKCISQRTTVNSQLSLLGMEDHVVCDRVTEVRCGKDIRRMMRLQGYPGKTNGCGGAICGYSVPARLRVAVRKNRGEGKRGDAVSGRKAADTAHRAARVTTEPRVAEISIRRYFDGFH